MNLDIVIAQLRTRALLFGRRVGGAAQFKLLPEVANLIVPAAYVIPMAEDAGEQISANAYQQTVRERFAVVVVLSNAVDERGQAASNALQAVRTALFRALLGFQSAEDSDVIQFEGGLLLQLDRARMYYQFEFSDGYDIGPTDTWIVVRDSELPDYLRLDLKLDALDPFDPNTPARDFPNDPAAYPGGEGPDGRIEVAAAIGPPSPVAP